MGFFLPEDCFYLKNSVDHDEMLHIAAFHLGLHYLPKYNFSSIHNTKVNFNTHEIYRGSYIRACLLLNLLNKFKMR